MMLATNNKKEVNNPNLTCDLIYSWPINKPRTMVVITNSKFSVLASAVLPQSF